MRDIDRVARNWNAENCNTNATTDARLSLAARHLLGHLLEPLKKDKVAGRIAYALLWRNGSRRHFWTPYPGHPDAEDLRRFHADAFTVFEDDLPNVYKLSPREGK